MKTCSPVGHATMRRHLCQTSMASLNRLGSVDPDLYVTRSKARMLPTIACGLILEFSSYKVVFACRRTISFRNQEPIAAPTSPSPRPMCTMLAPALHAHHPSSSSPYSPNFVFSDVPQETRPPLHHYQQPASSQTQL